MKMCKHCGKEVEDAVNFCTACGQSEFIATPAPVSDAQPAPINAIHHGNVGMGILGAALFSLGGAILYFIVYQLGFIAGICGLATFLLAHFGYGLFSKSKPNNSTLSVVVSVLLMLVMILAAEYGCVVFEVFKGAQEYGMELTLGEAFELTPIFMEDSEVMGAFWGDLAFAYIFGLLAAGGNIINIIKSQKAAAAQPTQPQ